MLQQRMLVGTCAHHGCIERPNNLEAAQLVLQRWPEIQVMEIDFVEHEGQFISSHDHTQRSCADGSPLRDWVHYLCIRQRRTLYLDIKALYGLYTYLWPQHKFDCARLFDELERLRQHYLGKKQGRDIARHIWITSQDYDVAETLFAMGRDQRRAHWQMIADVPYMGAYVRRYAWGRCMAPTLNHSVTSEMLAYDYSEARVVAIDRSFIAGDVGEFVRATNIPRGATLVLYAYERDTTVPLLPRLDGYTVMLMYNYRLQ